jgi:AraC family transcriptional activator of pobA
VIALSEEQAEEYVSLFKLMDREYGKSVYPPSEVLRGYLHALLGKARADYAGAGLMDAEAGTGVRLLQAFTEQLNRDFEPIRTGESLAIRKVSEYADLLGVSQNHLNDTIQSLTGLSAGQHIRNRLIRQATMCLMHSDKTVSEIAYRLGYEDPSYFARFYKSQTGRSPSSYRKK